MIQVSLMTTSSLSVHTLIIECILLGVLHIKINTSTHNISDLHTDIVGAAVAQ